MIISIVLQSEGKTWDYFLFWYGFQIQEEELPTKKYVDKGQTLVRKLGQKVKFEDKKEFKLEEETKPSKADYEHQQPSADNKDKSSLFIKEEDQPVQNRAPVETLINEKIVLIEKVTMKEEEDKVQQRSPITILSEDEGYLLEGDELTVHAESRINTHKEFYSQEDKAKR